MNTIRPMTSRDWDFATRSWQSGILRDLPAHLQHFFAVPCTAEPPPACSNVPRDGSCLYPFVMEVAFP